MTARSAAIPVEVLGASAKRAKDNAPVRVGAHSGRAVTAPSADGFAPADPGRRLPPGLSREFSARFGQDLSAVRLHDDATAAAKADVLGARAYTIGDDVVLGAATPSLDTREGKRTLAHELTHVIQQRRGGTEPALSPHAEHESAASRTADSAVGGQGALPVVGGTGVGLALEEDKKKKKSAKSASVNQDSEFGGDDDSQRLLRQRDKQRTQAKAGERDRAGKDPEQLIAAEAEKKLSKIEAKVAKSGANQTSQRVKDKRLTAAERALEDVPGTTLEKNKRKSAIDERQRTPNRGGNGQAQFVAGGPKLPTQDLSNPNSSKPASHARPDYTVYRLRKDGTMERVHVNLKSHQIHKMTPAQARSAVREMLYQAVRNSKHLPEGERLIISFARTPGKDVQEAIKAELFRSVPKGGRAPISEIQFGTSSNKESDYEPKQGREPLDTDKAGRTRRLKEEQRLKRASERKEKVRKKEVKRAQGAADKKRLRDEAKLAKDAAAKPGKVPKATKTAKPAAAIGGSNGKAKKTPGDSGRKKAAAAATPTAKLSPKRKSAAAGVAPLTSSSEDLAASSSPKPSKKTAPKANPVAKPSGAEKPMPSKVAPNAATKASPKMAPKMAPAIAPKLAPKVAPKTVGPTAAPKLAPKNAPKPVSNSSLKVEPTVTIKPTAATTRMPPPAVAKPIPRVPSFLGTGVRAPSVPLRSSFRGTAGRGVGLLISMAMGFLASHFEASATEKRNKKIIDADSKAMVDEFARQLDTKIDEILTLQVNSPFAPVIANVTYDTASEDTAVVAGDELIEGSSYIGTTISDVSLSYLPMPGRYRTRDGSMSRGAWDIHEFETAPVELSMASIEELVAHARAKGLPLTALRAYAYAQKLEAGIASDAGRGPRMSAYWSQVIADMDSP